MKTRSLTRRSESTSNDAPALTSSSDVHGLKPFQSSTSNSDVSFSSPPYTHVEEGMAPTKASKLSTQHQMTLSKLTTTVLSSQQKPGTPQKSNVSNAAEAADHTMKDAVGDEAPSNTSRRDADGNPVAEKVDGASTTATVLDNVGPTDSRRFLEWAGTHYIQRPASVDRLTFHIYFAIQVALEMHREQNIRFTSLQQRLLILLNSVLVCGTHKDLCDNDCKHFGI